MEPEALRFAHTVVMAGTIASGAELRIEVVIASFFCESDIGAPLGTCGCTKLGIK
ncbi:MAG: hypothetical protein NTZ23_00195 [Cyanobium sp. LacPavin_0920_WC12_MAG_63_22]|nr:hypothetical protein [Cyanobium sp. LacPavin_0920_WC12_MAG_63_22]